jgi:hypothetical protein
MTKSGIFLAGKRGCRLTRSIGVFNPAGGDFPDHNELGEPNAFTATSKM